MLQNLLNLGQAFEPKENSAVFKMQTHSRTAGSMPVWEETTSAKDLTAQRFEDVLNDNYNSEVSPHQMSLLPQENVKAPATEKPFGFGDLIDIINPLHHIPVVGHFYRNITGDEIRGPGQVIGGAIFGGPLGAASSMINMLVKYDTGRDLTDHALSMSFTRKKDDHEDLIKPQTKQNLDQALLAYQKQYEHNSPVPPITTARL